MPASASRQPGPSIARSELRYIEGSVSLFTANLDRFERLARNLYSLLSTHAALKPLVHSVKYRVKDPDHLRDKLIRKATLAREKKQRFGVTAANLFQRVEDLAGVRILHLHTTQMEQLKAAIAIVLAEEHYKILSGPVANTWDDEYKEFFKTIGIKTAARPSLYTSVHYVVTAGTDLRCELQVRTLVEEVWGEVSHKLDYPHPTKSIACREQIKVLARVSSSCTRLVDSIFASHEEYSTRAMAQSQRISPAIRSARQTRS